MQVSLMLRERFQKRTCEGRGSGRIGRCENLQDRIRRRQWSAVVLPAAATVAAAAVAAAAGASVAAAIAAPRAGRAADYADALQQCSQAGAASNCGGSAAVSLPNRSWAGVSIHDERCPGS